MPFPRPLSSRNDFSRLRNESVSVATKSIVLRAAPTTLPAHKELYPYRVSYAVTKKLGSAVQRNRIKRRIKHALAAIEKLPNNVIPADCLIIARHHSITRDFEGLIKDLKYAFFSINTLLEKQTETDNQ